MYRNVIVEISQGFDDDEKQLTLQERSSVTRNLNALVRLAKNTTHITQLYRTSGVVFPKTIKREDSSLYMFKSSENTRVILTYDMDPVFNQKIISLYRIVKPQEVKEAFNTTAKLLYK